VSICFHVLWRHFNWSCWAYEKNCRFICFYVSSTIFLCFPPHNLISHTINILIIICMCLFCFYEIFPSPSSLLRWFTLKQNWFFLHVCTPPYSFPSYLFVCEDRNEKITRNCHLRVKRLLFSKLLDLKMLEMCLKKGWKFDYLPQFIYKINYHTFFKSSNSFIRNDLL
jgi:hypothetical protein